MFFDHVLAMGVSLQEEDLIYFWNFENLEYQFSIISYAFVGKQKKIEYENIYSLHSKIQILLVIWTWNKNFKLGIHYKMCYMIV